MCRIIYETGEKDAVPTGPICFTHLFHSLYFVLAIKEHTTEGRVMHITLSIDKIFVSAGKVGLQIELSPKDLMDTAGCKPADIVG